MRRPGTAGRLPAVLLIGAALVPGCAEPVSDQSLEAVADPSDIESQSEPLREEAYDPADPFFGFDLDAPVVPAAEQRRLPLRLRNDGVVDALVYADGGAGEVLVDSVSAGGSKRVDLMTRATAVVLRSATPTGRTLRSVEIETGIDSLREIAIHAVGRVP